MEIKKEVEIVENVTDKMTNKRTYKISYLRKLTKYRKFKINTASGITEQISSITSFS